MALGITDVTLLVITIVASAAIGVYHGIKGIRQTSEDYLLGSRRMKALPLAMSLTVGTVSAITIMGNAGEMYAYGTQLWVMDIGLALGMVFVAKVFMPIFYPMKVVSLYQYIECRFKSFLLKALTVGLTLFGSYLFVGLLLFPPSLILQVFTGLPINTNIVITGLACSFYSSFGGVKAVVYTDVLQSVIMIVGSLAIVVQGIVNVGSFGEVWDIAYHHGRIEFFNFDLDPYQRHSFWLVIIYGFFFSLYTYGVNQSQTQRAFSTSSVHEAQRVIYYAIIGMFLLKGLVNFSGIVIFANYADCDPLTKDPNNIKKDITVVVLYVMQHLTKIPGLSGLFVASIYAAVLSSVSTQVNSMTALVWEDFFKAIPYFSAWNDIKVARLQKALVMVTGVIGVVMGLGLSKLTSSFLKLVLQVTGAVGGPMVGLFLVAVYLPWVKLMGASIGFAIAIGVSVWIVCGQIYSQQDNIYLPMSHVGCPQNISLAEVLNEQNKTSLVNHGVGFYGISYCLNYCWGVLACVVVAVLVTAITRTPNKPDEVDQKLISPTSWRWFTNGFKKTLVDDLKKLSCSFRQKPNGKDPAVTSKNEKNTHPKYQEELELMSKKDMEKGIGT